MKKMLIGCITLMAMVLAGCSTNDRSVKIGTAIHDVAKAGYSVGGGLLSDSTKEVLENTSNGLNEYGEKRKVVRSLQDSKKQIVDTLEVSDQ